MLKKTLLSLVVAIGLTSSLGANDQLKADMGTLASALSEVQIGFFTNDKYATLKAAAELKKHVQTTLGDKKKITNLLPADLQYKSSIAINSSEMIAKYIDEIEDILTDRNMRMINKQMKSQKAFVEIQNQCFRCHNLVRDWQ